MFEPGIAGLLVAAVVLPHVLPLHRVAPSTAAIVWFLALVIRALVAIGAAIFVFVYLPQTGLFQAVTRWCLHEVLPLLATHLGISGHPLAHAAALLPALALAASLLWMLVGVGRAWLALRRHLSRKAVGRGPRGSTIVEDENVVVAVTGVGRSRLVVSRAALGVMDEEELEASLAHEVGHVRRRHRPLLFVASVLAALGRLLPGTRSAERELAFNLERDADEYAVRDTGDPLALASAICKAAGTPATRNLTALGGRGRVSLRLDYLVAGGRERGSRALEWGMRVVALTLATAAVGLAVTLPAWAAPVSGGSPTSAVDAHAGCH